MRHPLRVLALACALAFTPACTQLHLDNPIAVARTNDQRAYALIQTYAALIETATGIVRDPATPIELKRALGQAERAATPAVETLQIAFTAYERARADHAAAPDDIALLIAARRLEEAMAKAQAPISELQALVNAQRK